MANPPIKPNPEVPEEFAQQLRQLSKENALFRLAIEELPLGLSMFDANDMLILTNQRYSEVWGVPGPPLQPGTYFKEVMAITPGSETAESKAQPPPAPNSSGVRHREWQLNDGRIIEVVVARMSDGSSVALHKDVTEQKNAEAKITYQAKHDQVTALLNRRGLEEALSPMLKSLSGTEKLVLLYLDLDRFKAVNDTYGHTIGDELLRQVAARIKDCTRSGDVVVRIGGDEFVVIQYDSPQPASAQSLSKRLIDTISKPFSITGHYISVGLSIGTATAPDDGTSVETLMNFADLALYRAKSSGRGSFRHFARDMDEAAQRRRELEIDLARALAREELYLVYQPIVNLASGKVTAVETLLRWNHPQKGPISPAEFIPVAEKTCLILSIGQWVLHQACTAAAQWPEDVCVAVNVSTIQLLQGNLLDDIKSALSTSGLPSERLEIEMTESVMIENPDIAGEKLNQLTDMGVNLAIDDFGTGYSSLSYLHRYSFDRIKIDRSFIAALNVNNEAKTIVHALVTLSVNLGLKVSIEGIETVEQLNFARDVGATDAQGFLIAKPLPQEHVLSFIDKGFQKSR